jgi:hypothetical protein
MRGRADAIPDAGAVPWQVLWEAMKVAPQDPEAESLTHELGLDAGDQERLGWAGADAVRGDRYFGTRHGRQVEVRVQAATRGLRATPIQATWTRAATAPLHVTAADGAFALSGAADPAATEFIMSLGASPAWDHLVLRAGPDGVATQRRTTAYGQNVGWLYDLWLAERLLTLVPSQPLDPLAPRDLATAAFPYKLG